MQQTILLTGATGFVGGAILKRLHHENKHSVVVAVRDESRVPINGVSKVCIESFDGVTRWEEHLNGSNIVIHSAARVHVMNDVEADPLAAFRKVNVEGTLNLARQSAAAGVRRFIFISSIKVNGEGTVPGTAYGADDVPAPVDPYGISKMEAEQGLRELAAETAMDVVIIRPVLVYGPGVKANFLNMMRWLDKGVPLPFGAIYNSRSLVALDNLVDLVLTCIDHSAAANQTFLVSDGEDLSTTALLSKMAKALNKPARLIPVPSWILQSGATLLGKKGLSQRLCGSLQVDITKTRNLLGWTPPLSVDEALANTAKHFREHQ
ncbi:MULTISPECIES: SDR family oxidoreductase [Pseudomonas]|jgi:UDP-glucose 4-epimerase|uniref:SDR family oxidoreductase n=2 Tax=Pseudomonas fluorescens group TaxID=136843 RepID=A0AB36D488_9PSED|nr:MULTISPECIES: SDR family oxidoreductase [Pseudomonas]MBU0521374.1 SDR family oxidoreductase [Gammaproteobacteria bacterium]MDZ4261278.1 SDR family oxidoreductase [Pseudomonadota bacterium]MBU0820814.1 SDR family oxidoreductase [Gammaproteobacteria bacterium]MBU0841388.1 SDR family oxidoreductase [Gammaproteobacteria bacterium]MBU1840513.1 SDR family oxidoreductase [Gammaproteobacteria bacterium]